MAGYVFLSNSNKPSEKKFKSRDKIKLSNVNRPCLKTALDMGYEVYFGVNRAKPEELECELPVKMYNSNTYRSITNFKDNKTAYDNLKKIVEKNNIKVIHCNTPIGGLIGRLIGKKFNVDKVIYTAHGFHFYKGAPLFNNTILKLAEKIMAHWTDVIITMNNEDYEAAKKFKLKKGGKVFKVHGVGVDLNKYNFNIDAKKKRKELGFKDTDILCISAGDLIDRKNYESAIEAISKINNKNIHYLICGRGPKKKELLDLAIEKNVENRVHFLGFRNDIISLMKMCDIFLFTTFQEGLPRSLMEAMACGLPCIVSNIRGNIDLIDNNKGGILCNPKDINFISESINKLTNNFNLRKSMGDYNLNVIKKYDISVVEDEIKEIYTEVLEKY